MARQVAGAEGLGVKKLVIWLPLALLLAFVGLFASGLFRPDDRVIHSRLVGQALPDFTLPAAASDRQRPSLRARLTSGRAGAFAEAVVISTGSGAL